jgi:hypothetical protein
LAGTSVIVVHPYSVQSFTLFSTGDEHPLPSQRISASDDEKPPSSIECSCPGTPPWDTSAASATAHSRKPAMVADTARMRRSSNILPAGSAARPPGTLLLENRRELSFQKSLQSLELFRRLVVVGITLWGRSGPLSRTLNLACQRAHGFAIFICPAPGRKQCLATGSRPECLQATHPFAARRRRGLGQLETAQSYRHDLCRVPA